MRKLQIAILASVIIFGVLAGTDNAFSALFVSSLDVSSQAVAITNFAFSTDGKTLIVTSGSVIQKWTCTTGFDMTTCSTAGLHLEGIGNSFKDVAFDDDGDRMYGLDISGDKVVEYSCTGNFDPSTCSNVSSDKFYSAQTTSGRDIEWSTDGLTFFLLDSFDDLVLEYSCGFAFDVNTCLYSGDDERLDVSGQDTAAVGMAFSSTGNKFFMAGGTNDKVYEYSCTGNFDVNTCSYSGDAEAFSFASTETIPEGLAFSADGLKFFVGGSNGVGYVHEFSVSPAFDVNIPTTSTTTESGGGSGCSGDCENPTLGINNDGRRLVDDGFSYNDNPIDVEHFFTPYPLVTAKVGVPNVAEFKIYDNSGPDKIHHFEFAFGLGKGESIDQNQAMIIWDKTFDGIETIELDDSQNVLENVRIDTSEVLCQEDSQQMCLLVQIYHTFRAPLEFNVLGTNVWDAKRNAMQNYYNHGVEVEGDSMNAPLTKEIPGSYKSEGIITVTQTELYGNMWASNDGRIFEIWENGSYKLLSSPILQTKDSGNMNERNHSAFDGWKLRQAQMATGIFDSASIQSTITESFTYNFPDIDSRTQFLIDSDLIDFVRK